MVRVRHVRRTAVVLPLMFLVLAGTAYSRPKLAASLGLDVWKMRQLEAQVQAAQELSYSLDRQSQDIQEVCVLNQSLLADLVAGRLDLPTAARRKWDINNGHDFFRQHLDRVSSAPNYEAKVADDLIRQAGEVSVGDGGQVLLERLHRQYDAAYGVRMQ